MNWVGVKISVYFQEPIFCTKILTSLYRSVIKNQYLIFSLFFYKKKNTINFFFLNFPFTIIWVWVCILLWKRYTLVNNILIQLRVTVVFDRYWQMLDRKHCVWVCIEMGVTHFSCFTLLCVYVCVYVCAFVCVCVRVCVSGSAAVQTDESILMKLSINDLTKINEVLFSRILKFWNRWQHGGHFAHFG